ncbi:hypothetical protein A6R68_20789 [Neotoma lepida]|uniref:Uncharacterized protein n=1 Tax=Neotoma lepida TaxID=56216 RepID=A0A1A6HRY2_NEOLE|nr:hypothetical protein A6R68_20789 [Neotoma lepida]
MAAATLPSTGPCGQFPSLPVLEAAERALGLSPASLEEEEGEEEEEQSGRLALPPPTVLSIPQPAVAAAAAVPPPFVPGPRGSGVQPPLQLSPVIPPLCYGAADPLTSPGAAKEAFLMLLGLDFLSPSHSHFTRLATTQSYKVRRAQERRCPPRPSTPGGDLHSGFRPIAGPTQESPVSTLFSISRPLGRSRNSPNPNGSRLVIRPHPRLSRFSSRPCLGDGATKWRAGARTPCLARLL